MFVPLLVLDGLLAVALVVLLVRRSRVRAHAAAAVGRSREIEDRAERALDAVRRAEAALEATAPAGPPDGRLDGPPERRSRRRVRRVAPPATPDRP